MLLKKPFRCSARLKNYLLSTQNVFILILIITKPCVLPKTTKDPAALQTFWGFLNRTNFLWLEAQVCFFSPPVWETYLKSSTSWTALHSSAKQHRLSFYKLWVGMTWLLIWLPWQIWPIRTDIFKPVTSPNLCSIADSPLSLQTDKVLPRVHLERGDVIYLNSIMNARVSFSPSPNCFLQLTSFSEYLALPQNSSSVWAERKTVLIDI